MKHYVKYDQAGIVWQTQTMHHLINYRQTNLNLKFTLKSRLSQENGTQ